MTYWRHLLSEYDGRDLDPVLLAPLAADARIPADAWSNPDTHDDDWIRSCMLVTLSRVLDITPNAVLLCYARFIEWTLHAETDADIEAAIDAVNECRTRGIYS